MKSSSTGDVRRLASGSGVTFAASLVNAFLGFTFVFFVSRDLGPMQTGAFYECVALLTIVMLVCQGGASTAIVRSIAHARVSDSPDRLRAWLLVAGLPPLVLSLVAASTVFRFAPGLSDLLLRDRGTQAALAGDLRVFAFGIPLGTVAGVVFGATQGFGAMRPTALIDNMLRPALRSILAATLFPFEHSGVVASLVWVAPMVVSVLLGLASLRRLLAQHPTPNRPARARLATRRDLREFWSYAFPQSLTSFLQVALVWVDVLLLGALRGSSAAGVYATASRYLLLGTLGLGAVATAISPQIAELLAARDLPRARRLFRIGTFWVVAASIPLYLLMASFARTLMTFFGHTFQGGAGALTLLSLAMIANIVTGPAGMIVLMGGHSRYVLFASSVAFVLNLVLDVLLIPRLGLLGAATGWSIGIVAFNLLVSVKAYRLWRIHPFTRFLLAAVGSAVVLFGGLGLLGHHLGSTTALLFVTASVAAAPYAAIALRLHDHARTEAQAA